MRRSEQVRDTLLRFYEAFSAADGGGLAEVIAREDEGVLVIGTDPGDWVEGREPWIAARQAMQGTMWEGVRLEAGPDPRGYEEGSLGWVVDRPSVVMSDGTTIPTRLTGVMRQVEESWALVHIHLSVAVPDDEVVELQREWSKERPGTLM